MKTIAVAKPTPATYSSSFYKNLIDSLHEGVLLLHGFYGKVLTANKKACEILEMSEEDMTGHKILKMNWQVIHEDGTVFKISDFPASITLHTGKPQQNVIIGIITNSRTKWISVSSFPFEGEKEGVTDCVVVSFFDITDIKIAEKKAKENEFIFESYLNSGLAPAWITDEDGTILFLNEVAKKTWHVKDDYRYKNTYEIFPKVNADEFLASDKIVFQSGEPLAFVHTSLRNDGTKGVFLLHKFLLPVTSSKRLIAGHAIDITEEKKLEQELLHQKVQEQKNISQVIISTQDHERDELAKELHDNVNQILATASVLLNHSQESSGEEKEKYIQKSQQYVQTVIDELRRISKSLNTSVIKDAGFIGAIEDVVLNLKSTLTENVELSYDRLIESMLSPELKLAVYRIIQEQANNISRHSAATSVGISLQKKQNQLCLTISDNGKGFNSSQISKGAGLKTIRNRVEVMNGELEIITGPSEGCTLKIIVPVESIVN